MTERGEAGYLRAYGVDLHLVETMDDVAAFKRWVGERRDGILCFDTETTGLRPDFDRIRLAQFGDKKQGWAIPFERWGGAVMEILNTYEGEIGAHNLKFDARNVEHEEPGFKWPWHRSHDTMTQAHLVNPLRPKGLKPMSARLVDPQAVAGQKALDLGMATNKWDWATVPVNYPPYWIYAAMDPVLTAHNHDVLYPQVMANYRANYDLEMGVTRVVAKMEQLGMRIDVPYFEMKNRELLEFVQNSRNWMADEYGLFNPTPLGLIKFFKAAGVKMLDKKTNSGQQAMDKDVLESIDHPVAAAVRNMRKAERLANTYCANMLGLRDSNDRVHANFWTMGTRTARFTITDPALQTLPKKDTTIRSGIIPSDGYGLISFDMDQVEARLMAHFSGSQPMIEAFLGDRDFFCVIASAIYAEEINNKKDPRRQLTKGGVYGKIYGGGAETLAHTTGVTLEQMEHVLYNFDLQFPEVSILQHNLQSLGKQRQIADGESWIKTPDGRRLVADDDKDYTLTNYLIQTHAAEIMKKKLVLLDTILPAEVRLLVSVHDELVMEAPEDMIKDVMPEIQAALDDFDSYSIPLTWGGDFSLKSWGDLVD